MLAVGCPPSCDSTSPKRLFSRLSVRSTPSISSATHGESMAVTPLTDSLPCTNRHARHTYAINPKSPKSIQRCVEQRGVYAWETDAKNECLRPFRAPEG